MSRIHLPPKGLCRCDTDTEAEVLCSVLLCCDSDNEAPVFPFTPCRDVRVLRATKPYAEQIQWVLFLGGARGNDQAS